MAWVCVVLQIKRWHDLGKSGWLVLINLVPGIGSLISRDRSGIF